MGAGRREEAAAAAGTGRLGASRTEEAAIAGAGAEAGDRGRAPRRELPGTAAAAADRTEAPRRAASERAIGRIQAAAGGRGGAAGGARWSRSTCAPRPAPAARPGRNRWVPRPALIALTSLLSPSAPQCSLPPGPGSAQEMAPDEVSSCFPSQAGAGTGAGRALCFLRCPGSSWRAPPRSAFVRLEPRLALWGTSLAGRPAGPPLAPVSSTFDSIS